MRIAVDLPQPARALELLQKLGCPASLQDHIRNDVAVRSIAGSVVLYD
jgi:hypothetical protein